MSDSEDYTMYRMFYFFLFAYATYTCISACIRGARRAGNDDDENRNNANGGDGNRNESSGTPAEEKAKRLKVVRSRLEFRKILPSSTPGKAFELGPPIEPDLERGEGDDFASNDTNNNDGIDQASLELLSDMGFSLNASRKALNAVGGSDTEAAMDWIFVHHTDPDFHDDPPETTREPPKMTPYVQQDESKISTTDRLDSSVRSFLTSSMSFLTRVGLGDNSKSEECCSICLEVYKVGDIVARLKRTPEQEERERNSECSNIAEAEHHHDGECNHWFHEACILEWLQNHDECPLCRVNMVQQ